MRGGNGRRDSGFAAIKMGWMGEAHGIGLDLALLLESKPARSGLAQEMIFMANRLFRVVGLTALVVALPAHNQTRPSFEGGVVAMTTFLQVITADDVDQRTRLDLLLGQKQVGREDVIGQLGMDMDNIAKAEAAGLLPDALVDIAFADMCSRLGIAPADLMKALEEKGVRFDTLRKRLKSDVAREVVARMQRRRDYEDRLDYPLIPKK
jgi:hypothetical protein